jgi:hypothetical protein
MDKDKLKETIIDKVLRFSGIGIIGGLLGAWGGVGGTSLAWRRVGLTILYTVYALYKLRSIWALSVGLIFIPLTFGYGVPDSTDDGSTLGRFYYNLFKKFKKQHLLTDIFTRGTIALLCMLCVIGIPIINGAWLRYILFSLLTILTFTTISYRGLGTFEFKGKHLLWSEALTYSITTFCIYKIIG